MNELTIKEILQVFHRISKMDIAIFNAQSRCITNVLSLSPFCSAVHRSKACLELCRQSDAHALRQASLTKKPYVYSCPFGLFEAVFPIFLQEKITGYLMIGPALEKTPQSMAHLEEILESHADELDVDAVRKHVRDLPSPTPEELDAYCKMLTMTIRYIEANHLVFSNTRTLGQLIKRYIQKNLREKITLDKLSVALHCSKVTLTESFRKEFDMTIMQFVQKERMEMAENMLRDTTMSITEIADHCGFSDIEYFSKCFKANHGVSPSEWKKTLPPEK